MHVPGDIFLSFGEGIRRKICYVPGAVNDFSVNRKAIYKYIRDLKAASTFPPVLHYGDLAVMSRSDKASFLMSIFTQFLHLRM